MARYVWMKQPRRNQPRKRAFSGFAGVEASDDVRASFSSQLDSLKSQDRGPGTRSTTIYQRAMVMISDLVRYTPWSSSYAPIAFGGYYSFADIRQQLDTISYNNKPLATPATPTAPAAPAPRVSIPAPPPIIPPAPRPTTPSAPATPTHGPSGKPIASETIKGSFGSQIRDIQAANKGPAVRSTTLTQRATTIFNDMGQYEPWTDSSWGTFGGPSYQTWSDSRNILSVIINDNRPQATTPGAPLPALPSAPAPIKPIVTYAPTPTPAPRPPTPAPTPAPSAGSPCGMPWSSSPRKDEFLAYVRNYPNKPTDAAGQQQLMCQLWTNFDSRQPTPAPAAPSGPNFTDIAAGISSLLNPLASVGAGVFQAQQQAQLARAQLRTQQPAAGPQQNYYAPPPTNNNTLLIAGVAGGAVLLLLIVVLAVR